MQFILTADWHLRATPPRCRIDKDWIETQREALNQVFDIANQKGCNIYCVGDIFNSNSDTSFECISIVQELSQKLCSVGLTLGILAGNHDLLYHSSQNLKKSAVGILLESYNIGHILDSINDESQDNISAPNFDEKPEDKKFMFIHRLVFPDLKSMPPNISAITAEELLEIYPETEWIFTGDYHKSFIYEKNGRKVINPGCLICQATDFKDYTPSVYFIDTDKNIVEKIYIKDNKEYIDDSYILKQDEREKRLDEFISKVNGTKAMTLDFVENVENALSSGNYSKEFANEVRGLVEGI